MLALRKYKTNYERLCGQVSELNAQIDLQLQRHESDVTVFQASIADLQTEKMRLEAQVVGAQQALSLERDTAEQNREYSEKIHRQLDTAAELLKATEKRLEQQEAHYTADIEKLRAQLGAEDEQHAGDQAKLRELEQEIKLCRARAITAKKQELLRSRREKSKQRQEVEARATKLQQLQEELEVQRSTVRATKKQLSKVQATNDTLCKQLVNVKRDGAHLSDLIDSQRVEYESQVLNLSRSKKKKKELAKRADSLAQDLGHLQRDFADAKDEIVSQNMEVERYRTELSSLRVKLRQTLRRLEEVQGSNDNFVRQIKTLQNALCEQVDRGKQIRQRSRDLEHRKELVCLRELVTDNQQRATDSSEGVRRLRHELSTVQKLLQGCAQDQQTASGRAFEWAEVTCDSF